MKPSDPIAEQLDALKIEDDLFVERLRLDKSNLEKMIASRNADIEDLKAQIARDEGAELRRIKAEMETMRRAHADLLYIYHFSLDMAGKQRRELQDEVERLTEELGVAKAVQAPQAPQAPPASDALCWLKLRRVQEKNEELKKELEAAMVEIKELKLRGKEPKSDVEEEDDWKESSTSLE
ncbi:hypothetical protein CAEBREN_19197 [Caenorhabditis brenneri]|uniref:Uncharacterized protein n=1 Tax=Caenorhabditis brenneri TaxID=135651 RepID=G0P3R2_CAEBE|nr:hypothetical protein CAEBREN_19197 [Caenorhabditis brenneri]